MITKKCNLPLIDHKITLAFCPFLYELLGGVDVGEDGNKCNDEAEDPDCNNERDNNTPAEVFPVGLRECNYLTPPVSNT